MVGEKAVTVGWKSDLFGRCYAVLIVIVLEKVILQCLWDPLEMNSRFRRKTQRQKLLLVSWRHVGVHLDGHQHDVAMQSSINFGKSFLPISCIWKLHWPESWPGSLHIYLLLFPRYWTLFSKRFQWLDSENQRLVFLKLRPEGLFSECCLLILFAGAVMSTTCVIISCNRKKLAASLITLFSCT